MKKLLIILPCFLFFYACVNNTNNNNEKEYSLEEITGFNITSKNSELNKKRGTEISLEEMTTKYIKSGGVVIFKEVCFTLDKTVEDALNFYSNNGKLMCNVPTQLSVMSMPPDGKGLVSYSRGDDIEISGTTLIKIDSVNFVISDITYR